MILLQPSSSPKTPKKVKVSKVNEAAKSQTISGKKVKDIIANKTLQVDGYRMFDMIIFEDIINTLLCPECKEKELHIYEDDFKRKGMASFLGVQLAISLLGIILQGL